MSDPARRTSSESAAARGRRAGDGSELEPGARIVRLIWLSLTGRAVRDSARNDDVVSFEGLPYKTSRSESKQRWR